MKRIICCLMAGMMIFMAGCSSQGPRAENTDGLSVITMRQDMCIFSGDEKGCHGIISDENNIRLTYIDFETSREKLIAEKLEIPPAIQADIFQAENVLYLHTAGDYTDYSSTTSTLSQLAPDGTVTAQMKFPLNSTMGEAVVQDADFIYTVMEDRTARISTLIRINKADMMYEMLADFNFGSQIRTVYDNSIVIQSGGRMVSYDTVTKQQTVLLETSSVLMFGSGGKLFEHNGCYSEIEIFDIPSETQYTAKIKSPGMLADFTVYNDCVIPGCLTLYTRSEIRDERIIHYLDTATMEVVRTIKMADFSSQQPLARCGDKLLLMEMKHDTYPFIYEYKVCMLDDYLAGTEEYTVINMLEQV